MRLGVLFARIFGGSIAAYVAFLAALCHPRVQVALVTLNWVRWPLFAKFSQPERYGFGVDRVRNLYITTSDGAKLGSWLALAETPWRKLREREKVEPSDINFAFQQRPTILYFHGNAASRAAGLRLAAVRSLLSLDVNVLIVDYRGFGDSSSELSTEQGLNLDARAAWNWLAARSAPESIAIVAQSLGTGIASQLAASLAAEGVTPRALVLVAPFTSMSELLQTYRLFKFIPILGLIKHIPGAEALLNRFLTFRFDSAAALPAVRSPILLVHARDDSDIWYQHSRMLFDRLQGEATVHSEDVGSGYVATYSRTGAGNVTHLELEHGGHNDVQIADETRRMIAKTLRLDSWI